MKLKIFAFLFGLSVVLAPVMALADDYGLGDTATAAGISQDRTITQILGDVVGSALSLVSILFFGLMLYAGIKWMLARGDSGESEQAMSTITYAIIGLVVILASYAITNFVFDKVGNTGRGGNNGNDPTTTTSCKTNYGGAGLTCQATLADCDSGVDSVATVDTAYQSKKEGLLDDSGYAIKTQCGTTNFLCCIPK